MRHARLLLLAAITGAVAAAIACGTGATEHLTDLGTDGAEGGSSVVLGPDNKPAPTGPAGSGLVTGLPCDVQALLENRCIRCHSGEQPGTPRLLDYNDLTAPSTVAGKTMAQTAVDRMQSTTAPMPPAPATPADADEIQTMKDWVAGGTKKGGLCTDPPPDAGPPPIVEAGADAAPPCLSGSMWTQGNTKSPLMHPGDACNGCHQAVGGPNLRFAGTVYKAPHDVTDCNGAAPPPTITVTVTDSKGVSLAAIVNDAGNFEVEATKPRPGPGGGSNKLTAPYTAKISDGTKTRVMTGKVTSGDCNFCHTAPGINGAPGRILAP